MIEVLADSSLATFLPEVAPLLYQQEHTNSLMLGLCGMLATAKEPMAPLLIRILQDGKTVSAALQTPAHNLVLTYAEDEQLQELAKFLIEKKMAFPGVVGPAHEAETFAKTWAELSGCPQRLGMAQKIFKIENVILPEGVSGNLRPAHLDEVDLIARWTVKFASESLPPNERRSFEATRPGIEKVVQKQQAYIWEADGQPVSMAHVGRPTRNGISIQAVFTPKPWRKHGYASAVVAHLSQKMLQTGKKFCVLYTDLSNSTSNKIYQQIGYREVADSKYYVFMVRI